ncbi:uncharacterized protein LAJ45_10952 [Morchella importuna]|uniref:uncharacterized protein n=1 Tax=Morchella importuna TaxID=1174673 RepID=UPI001E8D3494|nr:uncharacterized protein LAJ45_10952 [Morchella importuna]KAH8145041.1 hypothetical protein LAJ45_10952 [Morchella importuna]
MDPTRRQFAIHDRYPDRHHIGILGPIKALNFCQSTIEAKNVKLKSTRDNMVVIALSLLFPERSIDADERRRGVFASCVAVAICIDTREDWVTLVGREGGGHGSSQVEDLHAFHVPPPTKRLESDQNINLPLLSELSTQMVLGERGKIAERKIETCPGLLATLVAGRVHGELSGRLSMSEYFENQFMQFGWRCFFRKPNFDMPISGEKIPITTLKDSVSDRLVMSYHTICVFLNRCGSSIGEFMRLKVSSRILLFCFFDFNSHYRRCHRRHRRPFWRGAWGTSGRPLMLSRSIASLEHYYYILCIPSQYEESLEVTTDKLELPNTWFAFPANLKVNYRVVRRPIIWIAELLVEPLVRVLDPQLLIDRRLVGEEAIN